MTPFVFERATTKETALQLASGYPAAKYLGGGTNLVDLMRETIERPTALVDVTRLSETIEARADGSLWIGAAATNTAVASHPLVRTRFPLLARAILAGASGQIRNMATVGGNILQRTRCTYFYDKASKCNKREPGSGCDAIGGFNRYHAILGASDTCIATHPSDMCVALAALDATVHLDGPNGTRSLNLADLHRLPGDDPSRETELNANELITGIELPAVSANLNATYRKVRDRASYAFALLSVAVALDIADGKINDVRIAFGGVASKPWRARQAEAQLRGQAPTEAHFSAAAATELAGAKTYRDNAFKIVLAQRLMTGALKDLAGATL